MLDKRYHYNKAVAVCEDDLKLLRALNLTGYFNKKSLAGTLSFIINKFDFKKYERVRINREISKAPSRGNKDCLLSYLPIIYERR